MTKSKFISTFALTLAVLTGGCDKMPCNGDLDGMWQLMEITEGSDTVNKKSDKIYYSFQLKLLQLSRQTSPHLRFYAHFTHSNDSIKIFDICERSDDNLPITSADTLSAFGITRLNEAFKVKSLGSSTMVLEKDGQTFRFRKF